MTPHKIIYLLAVKMTFVYLCVLNYILGINYIYWGFCLFCNTLLAFMPCKHQYKENGDYQWEFLLFPVLCDRQKVTQ